MGSRQAAASVPKEVVQVQVLRFRSRLEVAPCIFFFLRFPYGTLP